MPRIVTLHLLSEYLGDDCLWFEAADGNEGDDKDIIPYELDIAGPAPGISVRSTTGDIHSIVLEQASTELIPAIATLKMNLLPWRFNVPELDMTDSPLEEVLLEAAKQLNLKTGHG